ncbi:MAG: hypothetical protein HC916_19630 [Coleofasciculaceae cyanobacterium SM2_1_6]|nr:hypothetical protein [Coleofasciculaceae cyanobacterium SM2_1_6]
MELKWQKRLKTVDEFLNLLNLSTTGVVAVNSPDQNPVPDLQELALKETRKQTRIAVIGIVITLAVTILGFFAQELKSFLMSPSQQSTPEQKSQ